MVADPLDKIKAEVSAKFGVFDGKRKKLIAAYQSAKDPKAKLKILAKIVRQHGEYMEHGLMGGWYTRSILDFADAIDDIAGTLNV